MGYELERSKELQVILVKKAAPLLGYELERSAAGNYSFLVITVAF